MSVAPILGLRRAIITHLRADSSVTALVPSARIYGERAPATLTWPFVRYGVSDAVPGYDITVPISVFSKSDYTDEAAAIGETIGASLDSAVLTLSDGRKAVLRYVGMRLIPDADETAAWHGIVTIGARVARDCAAA